jgi:hypothetical protein
MGLSGAALAQLQGPGRIGSEQHLLLQVLPLFIA